MKKPLSLKPGDRVAIAAPSTCVTSDEIIRGKKALADLGFEVEVSPDLAKRQERYLAGDDNTRAEELSHFFSDTNVKGIFCARGGYGSSRTIPLLNSKLVRKNPKLFIGYSDITSLHLFFNQSCNLTSIYGPHPSELSEIGEIERTIFFQMLCSPDPIGELKFDQTETLSLGKEKGTLVGGCITLIASSLGTPYEVDSKGKVLFLEDKGVEPYQLDRMLTQLKNAGKFKGIKGIVFGSMINCDDKEHDYKWQDVVLSVLPDADFPILTNFPAGHGTPKISLPFGTTVEIDANNRSIVLLEAVTRG
ncbi:LD-carboxypeptidase [Bdellovibrionota bacterium]